LYRDGTNGNPTVPRQITWKTDDVGGNNTDLEIGECMYVLEDFAVKQRAIGTIGGDNGSLSYYKIFQYFAS
jgi:hypothetical protein